MINNLNEYLEFFDCKWDEEVKLCEQFTTEAKSLTIVIYNPGYKREKIIRLKISKLGYKGISPLFIREKFSF